MKNKKGIFTPITYFFIVIVFLLVWIFAMSPIITTYTTQAVDQGLVTGVEAFLYQNVQLWIFLFLIISIIAISYIGSGQ